MTVLAGNSHRQCCVVRVEMIRPTAKDRVNRKDVVDRRQPEPTCRFDMDAEILGVAIGGGQQPEQQLGFEKGGAVLGLLGLTQQLHDLHDARATIAFVLA
ncbi:hypothetical protein D3C71_1982920 [compost metagenome]